ncbi:MAG: TonB-dependent receptor, partial [Flavisolibacter sp.]|nr:TonB-dependent receptor [Flavisolibacter sp.]
MKKLYLAILTAFVLGFTAQAQNVRGAAKGTLQDSLTATPLADATITLVRSKDSSLISFTVTSNSGYFEIKNIEAGTYDLLISYTGMQNFKKHFSISSTHAIADFGLIKLDRNYKPLDEVVVKDDAPVKIKGDTVEFRAESFKSVKPNATVEDLLKKVPGMEVSKDGTVKSQGETVQKIYVDGKEFFGNDPKMATRNLSQDMVESIQVYDDMSEQAKFTQMDDGTRTRAINIKLKKDKKQGWFGKGMAGGGTDERYQSSVTLNRFNGSRQISVVGSANNLDRQNFSFNDVIGGMGMGSFNGGGGNLGRGGGRGGGGGNNGGGGGNGISSPKSLGFNYRDVWGTKIDVSGSLNGSSTRTILDQSSFRSEVYPFSDSNTVKQTNTRSNNLNQNLRFNFRMEYKIDSLNSLLYYPSLTFQHSDGFSYNGVESFASVKAAPQYLALTQQRTNDNNRDGYTMNQNLLFRHRFSKKGRTLTLGLSSTLNHSNGKGITYSPYYYFHSNETTPYRSTILDQQSQQNVKGFNNTISTSYTEPIGRNKMLELNYAYTDNHSTSDRKTFDMNTASGKYELVNAPSTNYFENDYLSHRMGANFRVQQRKYNYQLGIGEQINRLASRSIRAATNKDTTIKQTYANLYPTANFNYNFTRNKSLRFRYSGRTNQPGVNQLQDVPDYSNPLQVHNGNPGLKQEFSNSLNLNYNTFNMVNFRYFSANLSYSSISNKIVNSTDQLPAKYAIPADPSTQGKQLIVPVNLNGSYSTSGFFTLGLPFRNPKLKGSTFNSTTMASSNRDVTMFYKQVNYAKTLSLTQTEGINYTYKEKLDIGLRASLSYNMTRYDSALKRPNVDYWSQTYSADMSFNLPGDFVFETDFDYYITTGQIQGYNRNHSLAEYFF